MRLPLIGRKDRLRFKEQIRLRLALAPGNLPLDALSIALRNGHLEEDPMQARRIHVLGLRLSDDFDSAHAAKLKSLSLLSLNKPGLTNSELDQLLTEHGSNKLDADLEYLTRPVTASSVTSLKLSRRNSRLRKGGSPARVGFASSPRDSDAPGSLVRSVSLQRVYSPGISRHK